MYKLFIALTFVFSFAVLFQNAVLAEEDFNNGAERFVKLKVDEAIDYIASKDLTENEKKQRFEKTLQESFAIKTIGRFSLGRYYRMMSEDEKKQFFSLFERYIIDVYSKRLNGYSGESFVVDGSRLEDNEDVIVHSKLVPASGAPVVIDWRIRERNGKMKVIDVIVEGVSMSLTQRSDFSSVIQRNGGKPITLIQYLEKQTAS